MYICASVHLCRHPPARQPSPHARRPSPARRQKRRARTPAGPARHAGRNAEPASSRLHAFARPPPLDAFARPPPLDAPHAAIGQHATWRHLQTPPAGTAGELPLTPHPQVDADTGRGQRTLTLYPAAPATAAAPLLRRHLAAVASATDRRCRARPEDVDAAAPAGRHASRA